MSLKGHRKRYARYDDDNDPLFSGLTQHRESNNNCSCNQGNRKQKNIRGPLIFPMIYLSSTCLFDKRVHNSHNFKNQINIPEKPLDLRSLVKNDQTWPYNLCFEHFDTIFLNLWTHGDGNYWKPQEKQWQNIEVQFLSTMEISCKQILPGSLCYHHLLISTMTPLSSTCLLDGPSAFSNIYPTSHNFRNYRKT